MELEPNDRLDSMRMEIPISENILETIICNSPQLKIRERGLDCFSYSKIFRQVNLGKYGRADLITATLDISGSFKRLRIKVYELKQGEVNSETFLQCLGYMKAVEQFLAKHVKLSCCDISIIPVLIGSKLNLSTNISFLTDFYTDLYIYTYEFGFDGITFKQHAGYQKTGNQFPSSTVSILDNLSRELIKNRFGIPSRRYIEDLPF